MRHYKWDYSFIHSNNIFRSISYQFSKCLGIVCDFDTVSKDELKIIVFNGILVIQMYRGDGSVILKGPVQWSTVNSHALNFMQVVSYNLQKIHFCIKAYFLWKIINCPLKFFPACKVLIGQTTSFIILWICTVSLLNTKLQYMWYLGLRL